MNEQKTNKIFNYILIGIGVLSIIFAVLCFVLNGEFDYGYYVAWETYGGDAYTGIQNAAAATANQVDRLNESVATLAKCVKMGFGFILLIFGFLITLYGVKNIIKEKTNEKQPITDISNIQ